MVVELGWRGFVTNEELDALHAEGFDHAPFGDDWETSSLVTASAGSSHEITRAFSSASSTWRGTGVHVFLLDTLVSVPRRGRGVGSPCSEQPTVPPRRTASGST